MKNEADKLNCPPRHGYITELAKLCNCSRKTVSRSLFKGYSGPKADKVKETFKKLFTSNNQP
ncbi:MAG: hypothetical protein Q7J05_01130 [Paludibacter sp.]|nr:hypothetical protein [Paludibacter sp.]